jgi:hypothetical protein
LRSSLRLTADDVLVITSIVGARRLSEERSLQQQTGGSAKIEFTVGLADAGRAQAATNDLSGLSSGATQAVQQFSRALDESLVRRGRPAVRLQNSQVKFGAAEVVTTSNTANNANAASWSWQPGQTNSQAGFSVSSSGNNKDSPASGQSSSSNTLIIILIAVLGVLALALISRQKMSSQQSALTPSPATGDAYAHKVHDVAEDDNVSMGFEQ